MAGDLVGDFYVHRLTGQEVSSELESSTKLLRGQPTVIHFYDGGWGGCRPCAVQMESWAQAYSPRVQFLCVCIDSVGVAQMFDRMFRFQCAVNVYIPSRAYFPKGYGQLGCSGFIVSDAQGNFISRKTKAYLQYGEDAFRHVEALLAEHLPSYSTGGWTSESKDDAFGTDYLPPPTGIISMDDEHESCAHALKALTEQPTVDNLRRAIQEMETHFAHEEALMVKHKFGGDGGPFSALNSHAQDHKRILDLGQAELERISNIATNSSCNLNDKGAWHNAVVSIDPKVATAIGKAFQTHAVNFDSLYVSNIPSTAE